VKKLFPFLFLFLFTQCEKDNFPDITTSGEHTFGCRVNGTEWTPKKSPNSLGISATDSPLDARYEQIADVMLIKATHYYSEANRKTIKVIIRSPEEGNTYDLAFSVSPLLYFDCSSYQIDSTVQATVTIDKFNLSERIISGTFEYTAIGEDGCSDKVEITDGRFDLNYRL